MAYSNIASYVKLHYLAKFVFISNEMNVLIACEYSGIVREAFAKKRFPVLLQET